MEVPNWAFDAEFYLEQVARAFDTALDELHDPLAHYLCFGEKRNLRPNRFFDPSLVRLGAQYLPRHFKNVSLLEGWLALPKKHAYVFPTSLSFDPVYYGCADLGDCLNPLEHYLKFGADRNPLEWFDEKFYRETYPDIAQSVENGHFRNGYDHFLRYGAAEGRTPSPDIELNVESDSSLLGFERFVAAKRGLAPVRVSTNRDLDEDSCKKLFKERAEFSAHLAGASIGDETARLDFSCYEPPLISVVVPVFNAFALTLQTLRSLRETYQGALEVVIVDCASTDETRRLNRWVSGVKIKRLEERTGYLKATREGYALCTSPYILLLNNDVRLFPFAIDFLLQRMVKENAGAVCARIVRTHMALQEGGSIVWSDGATYGYRRQDAPFTPEADFVRSVDFGSAACLLLDARAVREAGGLFDDRFLPAYFEDTDLCLRLRQAGFEVVYEPQATVEHLEFGSSGDAGAHELIQENWGKFFKKHEKTLVRHIERDITKAVKARFAGKDKAMPRILFFEDRVPYRHLGSGYVRSNEIIRMLDAMSVSVTVYPVYDRKIEDAHHDDFPERAEIMHGFDLSKLDSFLEERADYYDAVWVGRTHNFPRVDPYLKARLENVPVILDTEAVVAPREQARLALEGHRSERSLKECLREEFKGVEGRVAKVVCVNEIDAALVKSVLKTPVCVLGHYFPHMPPAPDFDEEPTESEDQDGKRKKGLLFLGALHDEKSPNFDSLKWFLDNVWDDLRSAGRDDLTELTIAGYVAPGVSLTPLLRAGVKSVSFVENVAELAHSHQIFIAPTRFAGGMPYKVHEMATLGMPCAITDILADQLGWQDGSECAVASVGDAEGFRDAILKLDADDSLRNRIRTNAYRYMERNCGKTVFRENLERVLKGVIKRNKGGKTA